MQGSEVKGYCVARLHVPTTDVELFPILFNVRHRFGSIFRVQIGTIKTRWPELLTPFMGAGNVFDATLPRHRIDGHPETHRLLSINNIVRLIMMPGSCH